DQSPPAETVLRTVLEKSRSREVVGLTCLGLARYLVGKGTVAERPWFDADAKSSWDQFRTTRWDPNFFRYMREADPRASYVEAEHLLEGAIKDYDDLVYWKDPNKPDRHLTIADFARLDLNNLHRSIGQVAPEIEGHDLDGKPMKLSDYRGKVVILSFWGSW